jgi:hypothetical protein
LFWPRSRKALVSITGTVVDPSGAVIPGCSVTLRGAGVDLTTESNTYGGFEFSELAAGLYSVEVAHPGFKTTTEQRVRVHEGGVSLLRVALPLGVSPFSGGCPPEPPAITMSPGSPGIFGSVGPVSPPAPLESIIVTIRDTKHKNRSFSTHLDVKRQFAFENIPDGTYSLIVHGAAHADFVVDAIPYHRVRTDVGYLPLSPCPARGKCRAVRKIEVLCL